MSRSNWLTVVVLLISVAFAGAVANGQEHSAEKIAGGPAEAEGVSDEILKRIDDSGVRIKRGETRTVCELWFCKDLAIDPDFKASPTRLYPFVSGQLIGLLHFPRRGSDFRDQTISSGWYTLRFGLQPVDGNHVGTSPTSDFLLLVAVEQDDLPETWEADGLIEASAEAAGSAHPAMLCLQRPSEGAELDLRHDDGNDWWVLHLNTQAVAKEKPQALAIDLVVVGHAAE